MEAQSLLLLDLERCTRCDLCVRACADAHDGVTRLVRDGLRFDKYLVATSCRSCRDPLCMVGCPVGSIRRRDSLEIMIEDWCIGCGLCAQNCPYGNINMHPFDGQCRDPAEARAEEGRGQAKGHHLRPQPGVLRAGLRVACPHDAAMRVEPLSSSPRNWGRKSDGRDPRRHPPAVDPRLCLALLVIADRRLSSRTPALPLDGPRAGAGRGWPMERPGLALMIYAGVLGLRRKVPTWRLGRATDVDEGPSLAGAA